MTNVYFNFNGSFGIDATSSQCRANVEPTSRDKLFLPHLWKHVAMIFAVLVMSMANIDMAWGDTAYGFENNNTSQSGYPTSAGDGSRAISSSIKRTGSYSLEQNNNNTSDKVTKVQNLPATFKGGVHYIHSIAYLRKNTSNNVTLKGYSFYAGAEFSSQSVNIALSSDWTRVVNKGQRTGNNQDYTSVEIRYKTNTATKGDKVYIDDIVVYVTENNDKTDLKKPGSATSASATTSSISWTCGTDVGDSDNGATGIQATLIFHRTSGSVGSNDLTLNDQGIYSLTATEGPSTDQSGNWTLLSASVGAAATSYSGTFTAGHEYAIVHRDLAYNYSTPTYAVVAPSCTAPTGLAVGSITGTGATFTVTDPENTNDYEFYYSTSSTAPTAGTAASATSTSKTKAVTGLTANTTYYAWVRSKCDASEKSDWVAASPATFTTLAASAWDLRGTMNNWTGGVDVFYGSGTVVATVTLSANTDYEFKIVNGSTWYGHSNSHIGGNISGVTFYNSGDNSNNCHLLTTTAGTYTFSFNTSNKQLTVTYPTSYKVYYKNTASWGTITVYKYTNISSNTGTKTAWPGETVSTYEDICGQRYYYTETEGYATVIFNNNNGGSQTGNMPSASGDGKYVAGTGSSWTTFPWCIEFNMNGHGSQVASISVANNTAATEPSPWPSADGYIFGGWYTDAGCTSAVNWSANITEDKTYCCTRWYDGKIHLAYR